MPFWIQNGGLSKFRIHCLRVRKNKGCFPFTVFCLMRSLKGSHCNAWEDILYKSYFVLERENKWVYEKHKQKKFLRLCVK